MFRGSLYACMFLIDIIVGLYDSVRKKGVKPPGNVLMQTNQFLRFAWSSYTDHFR